MASILKTMGYHAVPAPKTEGDSFLDRADTGVPVQYYTHRRFDPVLAAKLAQKGFSIIVLLRDPRDICLSMADYIRAGRHVGINTHPPALATMRLSELRLAVMRGIKMPGFQTLPIRRICAGWADWQNHGALVLRYEDIARSVLCGIRMPELAVFGLDPRHFLAAAQRVYRWRDATRPRLARWRDEFDDDMIKAWKTESADVAAALGYDEI